MIPMSKFPCCQAATLLVRVLHESENCLQEMLYADALPLPGCQLHPRPRCHLAAVCFYAKPVPC